MADLQRYYRISLNELVTELLIDAKKDMQAHAKILAKGSADEAAAFTDGTTTQLIDLENKFGTINLSAYNMVLNVRVTRIDFEGTAAPVPDWLQSPTRAKLKDGTINLERTAIHCAVLPRTAPAELVEGTYTPP